MGYTNGALGAMQADELAASVRLAVTNPAGSGLKDLFGGCEMIVRPQEVMFSPSQVHTYNALGVKALCLYYSCVPFDAFKTLIPPLDDEKAFNPLTFTYKDEDITVLPTYSNADVCDAGCLRAWVRTLRQKQISGKIKSDLFLFINMDADAIFWESLDLPVVKNRIANTDGIHGLVKEVADLPYVVFDTPGGYLRTHGPVGTVRFTQDTADGNFTGYASWAEKPYNRKIWTAVERSRTAAKIRPDSAAFSERVRLLSTTHFGLAAPVLNIRREEAANALAKTLNAAFVDTVGALTVYNTTGSALQCVQLKCAPNRGFTVSSPGLRAYTLVPMGEDSVFLLLRFDEVRDAYPLAVQEAPTQEAPLPGLTLRSGGAELSFGEDEPAYHFTYHGHTIGGKDFFSSYLTYHGKRADFLFDSVKGKKTVGGESVVFSGRILLPGAVSQGSFTFTFFTSRAAEGIFVLTDVVYPYTPERDAISTENSTLGRYTDMKWQEAAPLLLSFMNEAPVSVIKRNFEGDISVFPTDSFQQADPENRTLDSFNNQLSAGLIGLTDGKKGLLLANARNVLGSMAFCPMRLLESGQVLMNPFGTFSGRQRHHPNRSGDKIPRTYALIAPQGKSLAPAYNGSRERAVMCLLPFEGAFPEKERLTSLLAFADGAYASGTSGGVCPYDGENIAVRGAQATAPDIRIRSPLFTGVKGNVWKYVRYGTSAVGYIVKKQRSAK